MSSYNAIPEHSVSAIASTSRQNDPPRSTTAPVAEKYVEDYTISVPSDISDIHIESGYSTHRFEKEGTKGKQHYSRAKDTLEVSSISKPTLKIERQDNIYDKLYNACIKGQLNIVKDILEIHYETLTPDDCGQTPLFAACMGNQLEIVRYLINYGYDVNHQDNEGKTPLHLVLECYELGLANVLMTVFKANVTLRDMQNWTPLHTALDRGYYSVSHRLSLLFLQQDAGTDVSWIQLHAACYENNLQRVQFLLDTKADVNHTSFRGLTPLHVAVVKRNVALVTLLLDHNANVNSADYKCLSPLHIAIHKGANAMVQLLLKYKADVNHQDADGDTSLLLAVHKRQETMIPMLLEAGADVNAQDQDGDTSLHLIILKTFSVQTMYLLIDHGANVEAMNNKGKTPLLLASTQGKVNYMTVLLNANANPNVTDEKGYTVLHHAIHKRCAVQTLQAIIDCGAHVNVPNYKSVTPLNLACRKGNIDAMKVLLNAAVDPNIADADGDTVLHHATHKCCAVQTLQAIIDYGAHVNVPNYKSLTPLNLACRKGNIDAMNVLLNAAADPNVADADGDTVLHNAIFKSCNTEMLTTIIDRGANVNAINNKHRTALMLACKAQNEDAMKILLGGRG